MMLDVVDQEEVATVPGETNIGHAKGTAPLPREFDITDMLPAVGKDGRPLKRFSSGLKYVLREDLAAVLHSDDHARILLIDMRRPYEFAGGHMRHAMNVDWRAENHERQMQTILHRCAAEMLVVYCEFGGKRSPQAATLAAKVFAAKRNDNLKGIRILLGGYSGFFSQYPEACIGDYIPE
mmetsp:Transcript_26742/g.48355  ORF Transcript_26742/g.48355 Transcript_26742/m.48355 type:complete len:180 (-) Transcript_26742:304-843(-)